jgi:hypothetical protein
MRRGIARDIPMAIDRAAAELVLDYVASNENAA